MANRFPEVPTSDAPISKAMPSTFASDTTTPKPNTEAKPLPVPLIFMLAGLAFVSVAASTVAVYILDGDTHDVADVFGNAETSHVQSAELALRTAPALRRSNRGTQVAEATQENSNDVGNYRYVPSVPEPYTGDPEGQALWEQQVELDQQTLQPEDLEDDPTPGQPNLNQMLSKIPAYQAERIDSDGNLN